MAKLSPLPGASPACRFELRPTLAPRIVPIGRSGEPVIVIDGLMADPSELIEEGARATYAPADGERGGYPGLRAPLPGDYVERLLGLADQLLPKAFDLPGIRFARAESAFSLVTRRPETLHPLQRLPHVDTSSPLRFALLHYLCGPPYGGTAFFRQDSTGLEQVPPADSAAYLAARRDRLAELAELAAQSGYPGPGTPGYTRTAAFGARMDRLLIYRSFSLHSGIIPPGLAHPADPGAGRLTANIFADYRK
jgi:hypothetical protein